MHRKLIILCVTALLILTCSFTALAQEFDPEKSGSISITLTEQYDKEPIVGAELCVYHIATVMPDADGKLTYQYTQAFKSLGIALDDAALAEKLDVFVSENSVPSVAITTDAQGTASCDGLALGLYFLKQTVATEGFAPCTPFLVTIPSVKNGEYVYEVNASPKTEVARLTSITIKKVWNTDASTAETERITVELLRNGHVIETATLNAQNNWQVTYTDMPQSDAYTIREVDVPEGFTATYEQNGYVFTVTNTSTLIQTGQLIWPIPLLAMCGILFLAAGIVLLQKKRKSNA